MTGAKKLHETQTTDKCNHGANENYDQNSLWHQKIHIKKVIKIFIQQEFKEKM